MPNFQGARTTGDAPRPPCAFRTTSSRLRRRVLGVPLQVGSDFLLERTHEHPPRALPREFVQRASLFLPSVVVTINNAAAPNSLLFRYAQTPRDSRDKFLTKISIDSRRKLFTIALLTGVRPTTARIEDYDAKNGSDIELRHINTRLPPTPTCSVYTERITNITNYRYLRLGSEYVTDPVIAPRSTHSCRIASMGFKRAAL